eukprot:bmy_17380T0
MPKCPKCNKEVYFGERTPPPPSPARTVGPCAAPRGSAARGPRRGAAQVGRGCRGTWGTASGPRLSLARGRLEVRVGTPASDGPASLCPAVSPGPAWSPVSESPRLWVSRLRVPLSSLLSRAPWAGTPRGRKERGALAAPPSAK